MNSNPINEPSEKEWKDQIPLDLEPYLDTKPTFGLTDTQVIERRALFGKNELEEKKRNKLKHFLSFFTGAIAYLMEISIILTAVTSDWLDFGIILSMLIVNALIGYREESKADSAIATLKDSLAHQTRGWRNGQLIQIEAKSLVVGDIIALRLGDIVPADVRLLGIGVTGEEIETDYLQIDQSSLTGESLPVRKRRTDLVYSSSAVKQGQQLAVVVRVGVNTFIGKAAGLMTAKEGGGHFQKVINYIGHFLIVISVVLVLILFVYDLVEIKLKTGWVTTEDVLETLKEMVVLTIAAIPVGLPTVMSVTMAIGAKQLAKKQVIVKRLTAVEELASVSILCSDKTGTLTLNELTFDEPYLVAPYNQNDLLLYAYLASEPATTDPIEHAIRQAASRNHPQILAQDRPDGLMGYKLKSFRPFDPTQKLSRATILDHSSQSTFKVAKGAPQVILNLVRPHQDVGLAEGMVEAFANRGLRALGVARTRPQSMMDDGHEIWELVGLFSLIDPPRFDSAETIRDCLDYGLAVKMITGDQTVIAKEVAQRLEMGTDILDAQVLADPGLTEDELAETCVRADGFGRVVPEHKYRVIELLQKRGYVVSMTGDGVNDAPALKKANVGIAVHGSTDAARSAADIVLLSPGLSTIVEAIKTSRAIFQRLQSYALYRIASTIHFLLFFFVITLAENWAMPPIYLILVSVLNDVATMIMTIDHVTTSKVPSVWNLKLLVVLSSVLAIFLSFFSFAHFYVLRDVLKVTSGELSTAMYLHISCAPHFMIFSTRTEGFFWKSFPSLKFTIGVVGAQMIALVISVYGGLIGTSGIGWPLGIIIFSIGFVILVLIDIIKVITIQLWNRKPNKSTRAQRFINEHNLSWEKGYRAY